MTANEFKFGFMPEKGKLMPRLPEVLRILWAKKVVYVFCGFDKRFELNSNQIDTVMNMEEMYAISFGKDSNEPV